MAAKATNTVRTRKPVGVRTFLRRFGALFKQPIFIFLTVAGHAAIVAGSLAFYYVEHGVNRGIETFLDSFFWAFSTVTTVGYSDNYPVTQSGKLVAILLMMVGSLFLWSYIALFTSALLGPELDEVEQEVRELETGVRRIERESRLDEKTIHALIDQLQAALRDIEARNQNPQS